MIWLWLLNQTCKRNLGRHQCLHHRASSIWACLQRTSRLIAVLHPCLPPLHQYLGFLDHCCCVVYCRPGQAVPVLGREARHLQEEHRLLTFFLRRVRIDHL